MGYVNFGSVTAVGILFPILGLLALGLRVHYCVKHVRNFQIEDLLLVPSVLLMVAAGIGFAIGGQEKFFGGQLPTAGMDTDQINNLLARQKRFEYGLYIAFYFSIGLAKLSVLLHFRRLFRGVMYWTTFDYVNWVLITVVITWMIGCGLAMAFACGLHPSDGWSPIPSVHSNCIKTLNLNRVSTVFDGAVDIAILIEPIIVVSRMRNWGTNQKIQVLLMFLLADITVAIVLVKSIIWLQANEDNFSGPSSPVTGIVAYNKMGFVSKAMFWTFLEMGVGCIFACILPCRRYFVKMSGPMGCLVDKFSKSFTMSKVKEPVANDLHTAGIHLPNIESQGGPVKHHHGGNGFDFSLNSGSTDSSKFKNKESSTWSRGSQGTLQQADDDIWIVNVGESRSQCLAPSVTV